MLQDYFDPNIAVTLTSGAFGSWGCGAFTSMEPYRAARVLVHSANYGERASSSSAGSGDLWYKVAGQSIM